MGKLKVGIVGCGRISVVYKEAFLNNLDKLEVCYAVDKVLEQAQSFAKDFEGCGFSATLEDLLLQDLDVVHICTPHFLHKEQVIQCIKAGFHVLTEKPLAISLADADEMIAIANASDRKFGVIFQNRYISGVRKAKQVIDTGKLGKIVGAWSMLTWWRPPSYYDCDWKGSWEKEGGGVLIDQAIHSIDLVQYLVDSPLKWIQGHIDNRVLKNVEVEDVADAAIGFENGCVYSLFATNYYTQNAPIQIEIMGEKGKVHIKGFDVFIETEEGSETVQGSVNGSDGQSYWGIYHQEQILEFYESIRKDLPVMVTGQEGRKALEIVLGIYQSSKENRRIIFKL